MGSRTFTNGTNISRLSTFTSLTVSITHFETLLYICQWNAYLLKDRDSILYLVLIQLTSPIFPPYSTFPSTSRSGYFIPPGWTKWNSGIWFISILLPLYTLSDLIMAILLEILNAWNVCIGIHYQPVVSLLSRAIYNPVIKSFW